MGLVLQKATHMLVPIQPCRLKEVKDLLQEELKNKSFVENAQGLLCGVIAQYRTTVEDDQLRRY